MTVHAKKSSLIKIILTTLTAFALSACRVEGTFEFKVDGSTKLVIGIEDTIDSTKKINQTCKGFELSTKTRAGFIKNPKLEDLTSQHGYITCKVLANEPLDSDKIKFTTDGDKYILVMPKTTNGFDSNDTKTNIVISISEKVVKTTKDKIEDNKVVLDSLDFFSEGIIVTVEKEGASEASTSDSGPSRPSNGKIGAKSSRSGSAGGFPAWSWGLLLTGGASTAVAGAWLILGHRRRAARVPTTGPSQAPAVPSTLAQQAQPYTPGQQATNPTHYPRNNTQAASPSGYGYNMPPSSPQASTPDHTNDLDTRYRPR